MKNVFDKILKLKVDLGYMKQGLDCQVLRVGTQVGWCCRHAYSFICGVWVGKLLVLLLHWMD